MAKIVTSPFFPQDFSDYLCESGYRLMVCDNSNRSYSFSMQEKMITVVDDCIALHLWTEAEPGQRRPGYNKYNEFRSLTTLDFFLFALILHAMGAVSINDNFRKTNHNPSPSYPVNALFQTIKLSAQ